jgi:hypothetical protein
MISRIQLSTLLALSAIIWGIALILNGVSVSPDLAKPFSIVLGAVSLALGLFEKWVWRLPLLHPWFVSRPNLRGTWAGKVIPFGVDLQSQEPIPPIQAYLVIRQTFSSISIRLITLESDSELLAGSIIESADGLNAVFATYRNTPRLQVRDQSPMHYGGLLLRVNGDPPKALHGQYWTDRNTRGELQFEFRANKFAVSFDEAAALAG